MRSSRPKLLVITCDLLFVAALIFAFYSTENKDSAKPYFAAACLCLIGCIAGWIFGYRYETLKKKTQPPDNDTTPPA